MGLISCLYPSIAGKVTQTDVFQTRPSVTPRLPSVHHNGELVLIRVKIGHLHHSEQEAFILKKHRSQQALNVAVRSTSVTSKNCFVTTFLQPRSRGRDLEARTLPWL